MEERRIFTKEILATRLKKERQLINLTQEEVAMHADVARQTYSKWEQPDDNAVPDANKIALLCTIFDCDVGYLFGEYDTKKKAYTDIKNEIGLTQESIDILAKEKNRYFYYDPTELYQPFCLLDFLNFFITHIAEFNYYLLNYLIAIVDNTDANHYDNTDILGEISDDYQSALENIKSILYKKLLDQGKDELTARLIADRKVAMLNKAYAERIKNVETALSDEIIKIVKNFTQELEV